MKKQKKDKMDSKYQTVDIKVSPKEPENNKKRKKKKKHKGIKRFFLVLLLIILIGIRIFCSKSYAKWWWT